MKKIAIRILFNSLLGLVLIFIWSRFVDLNEILRILKTVELKFTLVFFILFAFSGIFRAFRLKLLLGKHHLPFKDALMLTYLGQFLSFLIPLRMGEMSKSVYLASQFNLSLSRTITWVFVDRFLDFLGVLFLIAIFMLFVPINLPAKSQSVVFILLLAFTLFFIFAIKSEQKLKQCMSFLSKIFVVSNIKRWFVSLTHNIIEGFEVLRRKPQELFGLLAFTFMAISAESFAWLFIFKSFGVDLSVAKSFLGDALFALTFLIPAAPGYVGSAEGLGLAVFSGMLGLEINITSAALVLFHILTLVAILVLGISSLYLLKFDLGTVWNKIRGEK